MVQPNLSRLRTTVRDGRGGRPAPSLQRMPLPPLRPPAWLSREQVVDAAQKPQTYGVLGALFCVALAGGDGTSRVIVGLWGYGFAWICAFVGLWLLNTIAEGIRQKPLLWAAIGVALIWMSLPHT